MEALADAKSAAGRNVRMRTNAEREGWESGGGEEGEGRGEGNVARMPTYRWKTWTT